MDLKQAGAAVVAVLLLILGFFYLTPSQPHYETGAGATFYVDPVSGVDGAAGDLAHPWKTLNCALYNASCPAGNGDTVILMNGTYEEKYTALSSLYFTRQLTLQGQYYGGAILHLNETSPNQMFYAGGSNMKFDNFVIDCQGKNMGGLLMYNNQRNHQITNMKILNCEGSAWSSQVNDSGIVFANNVVDNGSYGFRDAAGYTTNYTVANNTFSNMSSQAITFIIDMIGDTSESWSNNTVLDLKPGGIGLVVTTNWSSNLTINDFVCGSPGAQFRGTGCIVAQFSSASPAHFVINRTKMYLNVNASTVVTRYGIEADAPTSLIIDNTEVCSSALPCTANQSGASSSILPIYLPTGGNDTAVRNSKIYYGKISDNATIYGIYTTGTLNNFLGENNRVEALDAGHTMQGGILINSPTTANGNNNTLRGNFVLVGNKTASYGLGMGSEGQAGANFTNCLLENNYVDAVNYTQGSSGVIHAFFMSYTTNCTARNNTVYGGGYNMVIKGNENCLVANNTVANGAIGIYDKASHNCVFTGNDMTAPTTASCGSLVYTANNPSDNKTTVNSTWISNKLTNVLLACGSIGIGEISDVHFLNMTYPRAALSLSNSNLTQSWFVDMSADVLANFSIVNATGTIFTANDTLSSRTNLTEFVNINNTQTNFTEYNISALRPGYLNSTRTLNMTTNANVDFSFKPNITSKYGLNYTTTPLTCAWTSPEGMTANITDFRLNGGEYASLIIPFEVNQTANNSNVTDFSINNRSGATWSYSTDGNFFISGKIGKAFDFVSGAKAILSVPNADNKYSINTSDRTFMFWVYPRTYSALSGLINQPAQSSGSGANYMIWRMGQTTYNFYSGNGSTFNSITLPTIANDTWNHVAVTWTYSTRTWRVIVNANTATAVTFDFTSYGIPTTSTNPLIMGPYQPGNGYFNGSVDELKFFNKKLSDAEIAAIYARENAGLPWNSIVVDELAVGQNWSCVYTPTSASASDAPRISSNLTIKNNARNATIWYISKSGNDDNLGTNASPFLTVNRALFDLIDGDQIAIADGQYIETSDTSTLALNRNISIYSINKTGAQVLLNASSPTIFTISAKTGNITGISFNCTNLTTGSVNGIVLNSDVNGWKIENNTFIGCNISVKLSELSSSSPSNTTIKGNNFTGSTGAATAISLNGKSKDTIISGNSINVLTNGIYYDYRATTQNGDTGPLLIANNTLTSNGRASYGIYMYGKNTTARITATLVNNTFGAKTALFNSTFGIYTILPYHQSVANNTFFTYNSTAIGNVGTGAHIDISSNYTGNVFGANDTYLSCFGPIDMLSIGNLIDNVLIDGNTLYTDRCHASISIGYGHNVTISNNNVRIDNNTVSYGIVQGSETCSEQTLGTSLINNIVNSSDSPLVGPAHGILFTCGVDAISRNNTGINTYIGLVFKDHLRLNSTNDKSLGACRGLWEKGSVNNSYYNTLINITNASGSGGCIALIFSRQSSANSTKNTILYNSTIVTQTVAGGTYCGKNYFAIVGDNSVEQDNSSAIIQDYEWSSCEGISVEASNSSAGKINFFKSNRNYTANVTTIAGKPANLGSVVVRMMNGTTICTLPMNASGLTQGCPVTEIYAQGETAVIGNLSVLRARSNTTQTPILNVTYELNGQTYSAHLWNATTSAKDNFTVNASMDTDFYTLQFIVPLNGSLVYSLNFEKAPTNITYTALSTALSPTVNATVAPNGLVYLQIGSGDYFEETVKNALGGLPALPDIRNRTYGVAFMLNCSNCSGQLAQVSLNLTSKMRALTPAWSANVSAGSLYLTYAGIYGGYTGNLSIKAT